MEGKLKLQGRPLTPEDGDRVVLEVFIYPPLNQLTRLLAREYVIEFIHRESFKLRAGNLQVSQTSRRFAYLQAYLLMERQTLLELITE